MSGMGEKYSFYDSETLNSESDPLRTEFGSVWTEDSSSFWTSWKPDQLPSFGISTSPKFDIEFGPIVVTKSESAPYIAHHQSVKLIASPRKYKNPDCIDCGFHDDVRAALTSRFDNLDHSITEQFFQMAFEKYSSFGPIPMVEDFFLSPTGTPLSDCFHDIVTPLNEEDIRLAAAIGASVDEYMLGTTSFEYGDYVEKLEQVLLNLDEKDIPNFYLLMALMVPESYSSGSTTVISDLESSWSSFFNQAVDYLKGNICQDVADQIKEEMDFDDEFEPADALAAPDVNSSAMATTLSTADAPPMMEKEGEDLTGDGKINSDDYLAAKDKAIKANLEEQHNCKSAHPGMNHDQWSNKYR